MAIPFFAFADNEDVLVTILYIPLIETLVFLFFMLLIKTSNLNRVLLFTAFIATHIIIFISTMNIPYNDNKDWMNWLVGTAPVGVTVVLYLAIRLVAINK